VLTIQGDKCTFKARAKPERVCLKTISGADGVWLY